MQEKSIEQEEGISLLDVLMMIKRNLIMIVIITVLLGGLATFLYDYLSEDEYMSSGTILVSIEKSDDSYDYANARYLIETVAELAKRDIVVNKAIEKANLSYTSYELKDMLDVSFSTSNFLVTVSCASKDVEETKVIVDAVLDSLQEVSNQEDFKILNGCVGVAEYGLDGVNVSMSLFLFAIVSIFGGFVFAFLVVVVKEMISSPFYRSTDVKKKIALPVVSTLFDVKQFHLKGRANLAKCNDVVYRNLLRTIEFSEDKPIKVILGSSSVPGEGKTTTMIDLAKIMEKAGRSVLLVDFDLRKPQLAEIFNVTFEHGIEEFVFGGVSVNDIIQKVSDKIAIVPSKPVIDPLTLIDNKKIDELFNYASENYDFVLVDTTPLLVYSDALALSRCIDAVLFTIALGKTNKNVVYEALDLLYSKKTDILGLNLTRAKFDNRRAGYYY